MHGAAGVDATAGKPLHGLLKALLCVIRKGQCQEQLHRQGFAGVSD
jgi:hypothetical protein